MRSQAGIKLNGRFCARICVALLLVCSANSVRAASAQTKPNPGQAVLDELNQTIDWYRRVTALDQSSITPPEVLFRDSIRQNARQILHQSFVYARAQAAAINASGGATQSANAQNAKLSQAAAASSQRMVQLQTRLDAATASLSKTTAASRPALEAQRDELMAELNLAKARSDVIQHVSDFTAESGGSTLLQQIDDLERSIPDAQPQQQNSSASKSTDSSALQNIRPESTGIIGLIEDMFSLSRRMKDIKDVDKKAGALQETNEKIRGPLRTELLDALHRADALSQTRPSDNPQALDALKGQFDELTSRFKLLASAGVPLAEQNILLGSTRSALEQWHDAVHGEYFRVIRALLIRLGAIAISILILLGISNLWRRATFRYVTDVRRRRQFLLVRRLVVGAIIIVIVVAGVVTEFSSLATFAGLITAGIAVALQTVILSGVAHFFFLGRYGVRVGDRVTISGITGDVIDIGIFRLYMLELSSSHSDLQPTGRIVVFSNSVLFQPSAFYKQIPGANYVWHELALTVSPNSDYHLTEKRLMGAVQSVYEQYKEDIKQQHAAANQHIHLPLPEPKPQSQLRFVDSGLEFVVRYPVESRRAAEIDDRITRQLLDTIDQEPKLKLVPSGTPKIQPATAT